MSAPAPAAQQQQQTISSIVQAFDDSADVIRIGLGTITTVLPAGQTAMTGAATPNLPAFSASAVTTMPKTNSWWTSALWKKSAGTSGPFSQPLAALPLTFQAQKDGLRVGYFDRPSVSPARVPDADHYYQSYSYNNGGSTYDLLVGTEGLAAPGMEVQDYSDWSVVTSWADGAGRGLAATLTKGSPFAFFRVSGGRAAVQCPGVPAPDPKVVAGGGNVLTLRTAGNGHIYGLFAPTGASWTYDATRKTFYSDLGGKGYLSLALLPDASPATLEFFRRRAYAFVRGTRVDFRYDEASAKVHATYTVDTELMEPLELNQTVLALFRHQWLYTSMPVVEAYTYASARGTMKALDGNAFETVVDCNGILPCMPAFARDGPGGYSRADLYGLVDLSMRWMQRRQVDSKGQPVVPPWKGLVGDDADTYWGGKPLLRLAKLVEVADLVEHRAAFDFFVGYLKAILEYRFGGAGKQVMYYDRVWRTLIGFPSSFGSNNCNDHHFHYGYFVQAAATLARFDPAWAAPERWGGMVNLLIRDANGPSRDDPRFPFLRCFDIYEGHGWAGGAQSNGPQNQESSSESMSFSCGVFQWGAETGNRELRDLGLCLWVTERTAIEQYWFDIQDQVFPKDFGSPTVAQVWGTSGAYSNYWGGTVFETQGINMIPLNRGSLYLGLHPDYLRRSLAWMDAHQQVNKDVWFEDFAMVRAMYDPAAALALFNRKTDLHPAKVQLYGAGYGQSDDPASTYHWVHNLNQLGTVDATVLADSPHYQMFYSAAAGMRTYVAYNPDKALPRTVRFTDGFELVQVPPGEMQMASSPSPAPAAPQT